MAWKAQPWLTLRLRPARGLQVNSSALQSPANSLASCVRHRTQHIRPSGNDRGNPRDSGWQFQTDPLTLERGMQACDESMKCW
jgi:hypothetical protein